MAGAGEEAEVVALARGLRAREELRDEGYMCYDRELLEAGTRRGPVRGRYPQINETAPILSDVQLSFVEKYFFAG